MMGYVGTHCGAVEWGQRDKGATLVRLIGDQARIHLADVLSLADTVTRVDLAVTWRADPPDPSLGERLYQQAGWYHRDYPKSALPSCRSDVDGGFTAYLGKRESEYFFRLYNKEAECRAIGDTEGIERYKSAWRFELEVKGSPSIPLSHRVNDAADSAAYVQNYLWTYLDQHGVTPPFPRVRQYR
jgi:DNA relaxase NicK